MIMTNNDFHHPPHLEVDDLHMTRAVPVLTHEKEPVCIMVTVKFMVPVEQRIGRGMENNAEKTINLNTMDLNIKLR
ncbi:Hypothetical Protein MWSIV6_0234 [Methanothermobacter wolfeii]|nr:Hypothetical Protein MWSIV6_0234 [Methanothermobacter wolfeii]